MPKTTIYGLLTLAAASSLFALGFMYTAPNTYHRQIPRSGEREIKVTIEAGFAKLNLGLGKSSAVLEAEVTTDNPDDVTNLIDYSVRDKVGYLTLNTDGSDGHKNRVFHISNFEQSKWTTNFTDEIPISFDIQLGLGKGDFDLSGLSVKDLSLSAGASSVRVRFDQPNKSVIDNLNIEAGLSKFESHGLGNANFRHFRFQGGVGSYVLDFGGEMKLEADADIEVGFGSLVIYVPKNTGVKIITDKNLVTHFDIDDDFTEQREDNYLSSNYYTAAAKLNMRIDAGVGNVKIRRE